MCGIIGVDGDLNASQAIRLGIFAQQHRGQEAWGIICSDGKNFYPNKTDVPFNLGEPHKELGLVYKGSQAQPISLSGTMGIGHNRYSTQGSNILENAPPHFAHPKNHDSERIFLAQNGDIINMAELRAKLQAAGIKIYTTNDGEILVKIIGYYYFEKGYDITDAIRLAQQEIVGAYSAVLLTRNTLYAFRDPWGIRPLVMGQRADGAVMFASETGALKINNYDFLREVKRGEIIKVKDKDITTYELTDNHHPAAHCFFELVYFSRPDSFVFKSYVSKFRRVLGKNSAIYSLKKYPASLYKNTIVIAVPDSSNESALGFAKCPLCPLEYEYGLIRSHYTGRTFISPEQIIRDTDVMRKFAANEEVCSGKRIIVIDDSIVRGTTNRKIINLLKQAGAVAVDLRIMSPKIKNACHTGMDFHTSDQLIAANNSEEEIRQILGVDTLLYNNQDVLEQSLQDCGLDPNDFCYACLTGEYKFLKS